MGDQLPQGGLQIAQIKLGIYTWAKTVLAGHIPAGGIIWRDQSEPLPERPCVTFKIIDGPRRTGYQDNTRYLGDVQTEPSLIPGKFRVGGQRVMTISCQVFGSSKVIQGKPSAPNAIQIAKDLNASLSLTTVLEGLRGNGIAVWNQGEVNNLTALEETEYEERAQFDMTIGVAENLVDDPGIISEANITSDIIRT